RPPSGSSAPWATCNDGAVVPEAHPVSVMLPFGLRTRLHRARSGIERQLRRAFLGSAPTWKRHPNTLPWFDRPDALAALDGARQNAEESTLLEKWIRDGYVVVEYYVDPRDIDTMLETLDGLWEAPQPIPNLTLLGLREHVDAPPRDLPHHEVLALAP